MAELSEVTEQVTEQVADRIEEVAKVTRRLTGRELGFFIAGTGIGVAAGFGVGYFVMRKRLDLKYRKIVDEEIAGMREHYQRKMNSLDQQAQRRRPLEELVVERGYVKADRSRYTDAEMAAIEETVAQEEAAARKETEEVEVVEGVVENWDYAVELSQRRSDVPYIIHFDEFQENPNEHSQITVTYYEVDDVLADERDMPIDDMDAAIGLGNLGRWGHGCHDPNVVYIRNEELTIDYEVIRDRGSYQETVQGSIRHSASRMRMRPRRGFDDDPRR